MMARFLLQVSTVPNFRILFLALLFAPLCLAADPVSELHYPRVSEVSGSTLRVHHPVVDRWDNFETMEGWIPIEVSLSSSDKTWLGAVRARANTKVDVGKRLVMLSGQEVLDINFSADDVPDEVRQLASDALQNRPLTLMLDDVISLLAEDFKVSGQSVGEWQLNLQPPRVIVSTEPAQLMLIDQQPVMAPISGTELELVVNTDWRVFFDRFAQSWIVLNHGTWQTSPLLANGSWNTMTELPEDFAKIAVGDDWADVRTAYPPRSPETEPVSFLISLEPTELVVIRGEPRLEAIPGTEGLEMVSNTDRDLFRWNQQWFLLASGRWFSADEWNDRWQLVDQLPDAFTAIPDNHAKASVRDNIPGTVESMVALMEANLPRSVRVPANAQPGEEVVYAGPPQFKRIENTLVARAVNSPYAVIQHNNFYYLCYQGAWYLSSQPTGGWQPARVVPDEIYAIPPSDPLHYVTYVRPVTPESTEESEVEYTHNSGYLGQYSNGSVVVEGTGWHYPPWNGFSYGYPVYWGYPWTYGWGMGGPGYFDRRFHYWGGYWGPRSITLSGQPRTLSGSPETELERTRPGYTTLEQQRQADYDRAFNAADDLYVNPEGDLYRREGEEWSRHENGEWNTMAELERQYGVGGATVGAPETGQQQAYRQNEVDARRMERYYQQRQKNYNIYGNIYVGR